LTLTLVVALAILFTLLAYLATTLLLAREIVYPRRARPTRILNTVGASEVVLSATPLTRFEGIIGLLYDDEARLAVMSPGTRLPAGGEGVVRHMAIPADLHPKTDARACGNVFQPDEVTGVSPLAVDVQTATGTQPAWLFPGSGPAATTWVIHIHGMLAGRDSAFRSVRAISGSGWTSLVVSYPGDREAPGEAPRPSALGQTEWQAVDDAVGLARSRGATKIFFIGWSLGATIALYAAENGSHRDVLAGMLLISPVISWARSIRYAMAQNRVPSVLAISAMAALSLPLSSRLLRLDRSLSLPDQLPAPIVPTLVIHSKGDRTAPFASSSAFATASDLVELVEFPPCPHAMEWNEDPQRFSEVARRWIEGNHAVKPR